MVMITKIHNLGTYGDGAETRENWIALPIFTLNECSDEFQVGILFNAVLMKEHRPILPMPLCQPLKINFSVLTF